MQKKKVLLHVRTKYEPELIYKFITEEFFVHETNDMEVQGMTKEFTYEDFHPNHKLDIEEQTIDFLKNWFEHSFEENTTLFADDFFLLTDPSKPPELIS